MDWKLKIDEDGHVVLQDGKPVYIDDKNKEIALNPPEMYHKILDLNKESKGHREKSEELRTTLSLFSEIEDLPAWKTDAEKAMETVKNFNEKEWLEVKKVEKLKEDMNKAFEERERKTKEAYSQIESTYGETIASKDQQIRNLMVTSKFASSPLFSGTDPKTILLPDVAESHFGKNFVVKENPKTKKLGLIAYYDNGDEVYSHIKPGELAEFDEAMEAIFDAYPGRDRLLRSAKRGSSSSDGTGEGDGSSNLAKLQKQHAEALGAKDISLAITLKNKIFKLQQELAKG